MPLAAVSPRHRHPDADTGSSVASPDTGAPGLPGGAVLYRMPRLTDARGHLTFAERYGQLPFEVARYFLVFGVPSRKIRGEHAHRTLHQFLVCAHGRCGVGLYDGRRRRGVTLDRADLGLHVPPMVWTAQYEYSPDAVLLVLASDIYREQDYIRDLRRYQALVGDPSFS
jgi:UDP-2-acetamido-3-amino-2,3-dideoxy-glucuronate N-acetyltransferase